MDPLYYIKISNLINYRLLLTGWVIYKVSHVHDS